MGRVIPAQRGTHHPNLEACPSGASMRPSDIWCTGPKEYRYLVDPFLLAMCVKPWQYSWFGHRGLLHTDRVESPMALDRP
jgi:hypothetical protein